MFLGVNIDHIAVLREARSVNDPNLLDALSIVKFSGADQITIHLREDRRHIKDEDVKHIIKHSNLPVNLECSINKKIIKLALRLKPTRITLVPENRQEITTEGGLNVQKYFKQIKKITKKAHKNDIEVSLFIDPNFRIIQLSKKLKADFIELHTGHFSNIYAMKNSNLNQSMYNIKELDLSKKVLNKKLKKSIKKIKSCANLAKSLGLKVAAGHGLNYQNVHLISSIKSIEELNIGQSIIARSVFVGLEKAIKQMKNCIKNTH